MTKYYKKDDTITLKRAVDGRNLVFFLDLPRVESSFLNKDDKERQMFGFKWQRL